MGDMILYRSGGGSGIFNYPPGEVKDFVIQGDDTRNLLTWTDPEDIILDDGTVVKWAYTRIVRKTGSYPKNENDGAIVVQSSVRNQYQTDPYTDTGLTNGTAYYYAAFSCSEHGTFTNMPAKQIGTPINYKVMTVRIDESDSNPESCCSYADDAVGMPSGMTDEATEAWQEFFGYRPCLLKNGVVVGYLNPNDFSKFENGDAADITSGNAGDVMIEFPKLGIRFNRADGYLNVSMTNEPDVEGFQYYAHTTNGITYDNIYISPYFAYIDKSVYPIELRSISNANCGGSSYGFTSYCAFAKAHGPGFSIMNYYQFMYIQCMYVLQFKHLNSQNKLGNGNEYPSDYNNVMTGTMDKMGMVNNTQRYEGVDVDNWNPDDPTYDSYVKLFGLENIYGKISQFIAGIYYDNRKSPYYIYLTDHDYGNNESYTTRIQMSISTGERYTSKVVGDNELGFLPSSRSGSGTTYYCDMCEFSDFWGNPNLSWDPYFFTTTEAFFGLANNYANRRAGIFALSVNADSSYNKGRLVYYPVKQ